MHACSQEKSFVQGWEWPVRRPLPSHPPTTCTMHIAHCTLHIAQCTMHITHCTLHNAQCTMDHPQHTGERETYCSEILQQVIIEHHTCEHVPSRFAHQCKNYSIPVARGPAPKQYKCGPGDRSKPRIRDVIRSIASHTLDPGPTYI